MNPKQSDNATAFSNRRGEKTKTNPRSLTSEEKLDTQKGIKKSLNICQKSGLDVGDDTLNIKAMPITPLIPKEVIQIRGVGSK
jgi:hypothetical protein